MSITNITIYTTKKNGLELLFTRTRRLVEELQKFREESLVS